MQNKETLQTRLEREMRETFRDIRIGDIHECEFHLVQLEKLINRTIAETVKEGVMRVVDIGITNDRSKYEIAQLRFREKVVNALQKLNK